MDYTTQKIENLVAHYFAHKKEMTTWLEKTENAIRNKRYAEALRHQEQVWNHVRGLNRCMELVNALELGNIEAVATLLKQEC
ncbi:MAG: hypothetical protein Q8P05_05380 [Candidatus Diapherotrites archaeon]|nr:hypothetical protein [Candidatus Diapherotrites archaeon]